MNLCNQTTQSLFKCLLHWTWTYITIWKGCIDFPFNNDDAVGMRSHEGKKKEKEKKPNFENNISVGGSIYDSNL